MEPAIACGDFAVRPDSSMARAIHDSAGLAGKPAATHHRPAAPGELLAQSNGSPVAAGATFERTLTIAGAAGGVGTTTIAATLARVCSRRGYGVFFFDAAEESIVPLYLGAGRVVSGASPGWSFHPHPELRQGAISVVACGRTAEAGTVQSPWSRARGLGGVAADIVIDSGSLQGFDSPAETVCDTTSVVVLAPDIRCVLQIRSIEKKFAGCEAGSLPRYVLNQFNQEIPLHQEVRASLANHLGDRLAPITVRSAQEIPKALAEGLTVIDYAPNSPVASDIVQVVDWLRSSATSASNPKKSAAVAGLS
ncbi:MAG: cellulose synthase operon protein YhjQ/BcsQ [Acidobacteriota bacterium]